MSSPLLVPAKGEAWVKGEKLKECNLVSMRRHIGYAVHEFTKKALQEGLAGLWKKRDCYKQFSD